MARLILVLICLALCFPVSHATEANALDQKPLIIALMHFAPELGALESNQVAIDKALTLAKQHNAHWMLTPELALTGYYFEKVIGTDWIKPGPDVHVRALQQRAQELGIGLLLGHLERQLKPQLNLQPATFNTLFVINDEGRVVARHRKINTVPQSEDWSTKGSIATVTNIAGYRAGLLICADAWPADHAARQKEQGAQLILSAANWGPGPYGPEDTWEKRSRETGLPVIVNNRTGIDKTLDMRAATSVVAVAGRRVFEYQSDKGALVLLYWERTQPSPTFIRAEIIESQ